MSVSISFLMKLAVFGIVASICCVTVFHSFSYLKPFPCNGHGGGAASSSSSSNQQSEDLNVVFVSRLPEVEKNLETFALALTSVQLHHSRPLVRVYVENDLERVKNKVGSSRVQVLKLPGVSGKLDLLDHDYNAFEQDAIWMDYDTLITTDLSKAYSKGKFVLKKGEEKVADDLWMLDKETREQLKSECSEGESLGTCLKTTLNSDIPSLNEIYPKKVWGVDLQKKAVELGIQENKIVTKKGLPVGSLKGKKKELKVNDEVSEFLEQKSSSPHSSKRVLITGVAGFVGFHTALALKTRGIFVVGLDSLDPWYNVNLKQRRLEMLRRHQIIVEEMDLRNQENVTSLLKTWNIDTVLHLAEKHSADQNTYWTENLECLTSILETIRQHDSSIRLIYGTERENSDSMFKMEKEKTVLLYHFLYNVKSTALKFPASLYGSWARPDATYVEIAAAVVRKTNSSYLMGLPQEAQTYAFVNDTVLEIAQAMTRLGDRGLEIIELSSAISANAKEIADMFEKLNADSDGAVIDARFEVGMKEFWRWFVPYEEIRRKEALTQGLVLGSLFTHGKEHIVGLSRKLNVYGKLFLEEVKEFHIPTVLFLNGNTEEEKAFVANHTTALLTFETVELDPKRSLNDERFRMYQKYLDQLKVKPRYLLFSDVRDVEFSGNPFDEMEKVCSRYPLVIQDEGKGALCKYITQKTKTCNLFDANADKFLKRCEIWNSGLWGGKYEEAYALLKDVVDTLASQRIVKSQNCNMIAFNVAAHRAKAAVFSAPSKLFGPFRQCKLHHEHLIHHKSTVDCGPAMNNKFRFWYVPRGGTPTFFVQEDVKERAKQEALKKQKARQVALAKQAALKKKKASAKANADLVRAKARAAQKRNEMARQKARMLMEKKKIVSK